MLSLFSNKYRSRGLISTHPSTPWLRTQVARNIELQKSYYAGSGRAVFGNHPLAQALKLIGANANVDEYSLYNQAWTRAGQVARQLGFSSEAARGTMLGHSLYKSDACLWIHNAEYISPSYAVNNWQLLEPVKVLWSNSPYMSMDVPSQNGTFNMYSVVTVDLPMLTLMYRGWLDDRKDVMRNNIDAAAFGEENFIAMYVLPAMVCSQANITAVSALIALHKGEYEATTRVDSKIFLPSFSVDFKKVAEYAIKEVKDTKKQYVHILQALPSMQEGVSVLDSLILPDVLPTIQLEWALLVTRLPVIMFLLDIGGSNGRRANQGLINELKRNTKELASTGIPYNVMTDTVANYVDYCVRYIAKL